MAKQLFFVAVASILVILGLFIVDYVFYSLSIIYDYIYQLLGLLFSSNDAGEFIHNVLALFIMTLLMTIVIALPVWVAKKEAPSYMTVVLWGSWLITVSMLVWR